MPAIYAHNQFGNRVLKTLDAKEKKAALTHLRQFRIGLQGPDYLFFYRPFMKNEINSTGYRIHQRPAKEFIENAKEVIKEKGTNSPEYAYILGFICHFALDSECHPYVEKQIEKTGVGHIEIESEFEKFLMRKNGEEPLSYPAGKTFPTDKKTAEVIAEFYDGISEKEAWKSLRSMKMYKDILVAPCNLKRSVIDKIMRLTGHYEEIQGHMLRPKDNPKCEESNRGLYERFLGAVPLAKKLMEDFNSYLAGEALSEHFDRNFE